MGSWHGMAFIRAGTEGSEGLFIKGRKVAAITGEI